MPCVICGKWRTQLEYKGREFCNYGCEAIFRARIRGMETLIDLHNHALYYRWENGEEIRKIRLRPYRSLLDLREGALLCYDTGRTGSWLEYLTRAAMLLVGGVA